jgi:uncharacterized protein YjbI with pentapeptide repeats
MANMDQVQVVRQGRDAVARWREEHQGEVMDLYNCYMSHVRIPQVDLSGADMRDSDFMGAMMRRANLSGCYLNPAHLYRADLRETNLSRALLNGANLRGADLRGANLEAADLDRAVLSEGNLTGANLRRANLSRANLDQTNLTDADLTDANLNGAALTRTNLSNANLLRTDFYEAVFNDTPVAGTKFASSIVGYTIFQNCDLSEAEGLGQVRHDAPSTVGIDTMFRSGGKIPDAFLLGVGATEALVSFQQSLTSAPPLGGEYFISCAEKDIAFAEKLQTNLRAYGIRSWVFAENFRGNALVDRRSTSEGEEVERWVRHYDKLLVVCSQAALDSETIRNDITYAKDLQQGQDQWLLYLIDPDGTMTQARGRMARSLSFEHVVFNLQGQEANAEEYQQELSRLADSLKESQPAKAGGPAATSEF